MCYFVGVCNVVIDKLKVGSYVKARRREAHAVRKLLILLEMC